MKRGCAYFLSAVVLIILVGFGFFAFVSANSSVLIKATVIGNASYTMIDVFPNLIDFKNIFPGQSPPNGVKINVTNTGTENVTVKPILQTSDNDLWSDYLYVRKGSSGSYTKKIGDLSFNLSAGASELVYFRLDLSNYSDLVYGDMPINANVTLRAVPQ